jgi:hypothetical protein
MPGQENLAVGARPTQLTVAGGDLSWLMAIAHSARGAFGVTVLHRPRALSELTFEGEGNRSIQCAIVELDARTSAMEMHELLDRSPHVRFVFVVGQLPLRHTVAHVIRERGHAVVSRRDAPFVIVATAAALMAEMGAAP